MHALAHTRENQRGEKGGFHLNTLPSGSCPSIYMQTSLGKQVTSGEQRPSTECQCKDLT